MLLSFGRSCSSTRRAMHDYDCGKSRQYINSCKLNDSWSMTILLRSASCCEILFLVFQLSQGQMDWVRQKGVCFCHKYGEHVLHYQNMPVPYISDTLINCPERIRLRWYDTQYTIKLQNNSCLSLEGLFTQFQGLPKLLVIWTANLLYDHFAPQ